MIRLKHLILEMKLHPSLTYDVLKRNRIITAYHASESSDFKPTNDVHLHVGSIQQSLALIKNMQSANPTKGMKYYLYEVNVELGKLAPYLFDEDPEEEIGGGVGSYSYDTYAYSNRIEYPQGRKMGDNISLLLINPEKQIVGKKLIKPL